MLDGMWGRIRGMVGVVVLATIALLGYPAISAGSVAGEPVTAEFNYVGLFVGTFPGDVDGLAYRPGDGDPVVVNGEYSDGDGNFKVPADGGLSFPRVAVDLVGFELYADFALAADGSGNYDPASGKLSLDLPLSLTLGVDDLEELSYRVGVDLGTGELACEFSPVEASFSTEDTWPHPGKAYENKADLVDGALAGSWRKLPPAVATTGEQATCDIARGLLRPVGGLWLANSTEVIDELPLWEMGKCPPPGTVQFQLSCLPPKCPEGQFGYFPDCEKHVCPESNPGTYPDCGVITDPMTELTKVMIGPRKSMVRPGKTAKLKIRVKARVGLAPDRFRIKLRSSNRRVKVPKSVLVKLTGSTGIVTVKVKVARKARGKATITASYPGLKAVTRVTVKKAVK